MFNFLFNQFPKVVDIKLENPTISSVNFNFKRNLKKSRTDL